MQIWDTSSLMIYRHIIFQKIKKYCIKYFPLLPLCEYPLPAKGFKGFKIYLPQNRGNASKDQYSEVTSPHARWDWNHFCKMIIITKNSTDYNFENCMTLKDILEPSIFLTSFLSFLFTPFTPQDGNIFFSAF